MNTDQYSIVMLLIPVVFAGAVVFAIYTLLERLVNRREATADAPTELGGAEAVSRFRLRLGLGVGVLASVLIFTLTASVFWALAFVVGPAFCVVVAIAVASRPRPVQLEGPRRASLRPRLIADYTDVRIAVLAFGSLFVLAIAAAAAGTIGFHSSGSPAGVSFTEYSLDFVCSPGGSAYAWAASPWATGPAFWVLVGGQVTAAVISLVALRVVVLRPAALTGVDQVERSNRLRVEAARNILSALSLSVAVTAVVYFANLASNFASSPCPTTGQLLIAVISFIGTLAFLVITIFSTKQLLRSAR